MHGSLRKTVGRRNGVSRALPRYQRLTRKAEALIASVYLSGTNTRRVIRALFGLFRGALSKDVVSRAWRKVKVDWDAWSSRGLPDEDIVRLILDGTVIKTRLDRKAHHYIFPPVPCPVIHARGDLDDRNSARWQNRQTAMLARTRPGPAGARGTPGRAWDGAAQSIQSLRTRR